MIASILVFSIALCVIYFLIGLYNEMYWKRRGVKFHSKNRVFGPLGEFLKSDRPLFDIFHEIYKAFPNEPAIGVGSLITPAIYVKDPVNIQHVFQNDFSSFNHRGIEVSDGDKLADNILFMNGNRWKLMRQSMTPLFTSAKLKNMFYIMDRSAKDFVDFLNQRPEKLSVDTFDTLCTFCSAAISASVFGLTTESVFDSPFLKMAQKALKPTFSRNLKFAIASLNTTFFKFLGLKLFKDFEEFFIGAISGVIRQRKQDNIKRHDFADICVTLQNNGVLKDHDTGLNISPTDEILAAQAFFFFIAGVEPSAVAMFFTLAELGRHSKRLACVQAEIDDAFKKNNGKMTYELVQGMEYLEMVINEAMRLHPPIGFLSRECVRDTILPVGNIRIDKGTKIFAPIFEVHHDPKIFNEPEVFKPERFSRNKQDFPLSMYMPFGKGNRLCVGTRYATLQVKTGLIYLLHNFSVKTQIDGDKIKYSKQTVQVRASNVHVRLISRCV